MINFLNIVTINFNYVTDKAKEKLDSKLDQL